MSLAGLYNTGSASHSKGTLMRLGKRSSDDVDNVSGQKVTNTEYKNTETKDANFLNFLNYLYNKANNIETNNNQLNHQEKQDVEDEPDVLEEYDHSHTKSDEGGDHSSILNRNQELKGAIEERIQEEIYSRRARSIPLSIGLELGILREMVNDRRQHQHMMSLKRNAYDTLDYLG